VVVRWSRGYTANFSPDYLLNFRGATTISVTEPPHFRGFMITLRHTKLGRTPLGE